MQLIEKLSATVGTINPRYDISIYEMEEIKNSATDLFNAISLSFRYGYLQGTKAAEAKLKEKSAHLPKYKSEIRQAIYYQVSNTKNVSALHEIPRLSELLRKRSDDTEYKDLSDVETTQCSIIDNVLQCKDEKGHKEYQSIRKRLFKSCQTGSTAGRAS